MAPVAKPRFQFLGGHPALDFTNTVSWARAGLTEERFDSYDKLIQWSREAKLPVDPRGLARHASAHPGTAARVVAEARIIRAETHELFHARAAGEELPGPLLERFNRRLRASLADLCLLQERHAKGSRTVFRPRNARALEAPLHWVLWEAATLLASNEPIKQCANPDCGWLYLDRSRRGNRRWCDMAVCGARDKARRYYRRRRLAAAKFAL